MVRRVAFKKAVLGGALGALAWEFAVRALIVAGVPMFDIVRILGTMVAGERADVYLWWPIGMAMHALLGAIWAIFYAYFFWSFYDLPPVLQGIAFAVVPMVLAGLIMIPQMDYMIADHAPHLRAFATGLGPLGPASVIIGHLIYGVVLGSIYKRPVGYATGRLVKWYG